MVRTNYLPMFAVGSSFDAFFAFPNATDDETGGVEANDEEMEELAGFVLSEFLEPFVAGEYGAIDPHNIYDSLLIDLSQYQDDNRIAVAMNSMSAAIGARYLYSRLLSADAQTAECLKDKAELQNRILELEHEIKVALGQIEDMKQVSTKIEAKVSVRSVEILPMIAQVNIVMGWYYYLYGYEPLKPIDPFQYLEAKRLVIEHGGVIDEATGRYGAYDELMRRLIADKAERERLAASD